MNGIRKRQPAGRMPGSVYVSVVTLASFPPPYPRVIPLRVFQRAVGKIFAEHFARGIPKGLRPDKNFTAVYIVVVMSVSGRKWKEPKVQRFSAMTPKHHVLTFEQRLAKKQELEEVKRMEREFMEEEKEERRLKGEKSRQKQAYKKEQQLLHAVKNGVQVVKDAKKVRKMTKKVKKQLVRMPPEMLRAYVKK